MSFEDEVIAKPYVLFDVRLKIILCLTADAVLACSDPFLSCHPSLNLDLESKEQNREHLETSRRHLHFQYGCDKRGDRSVCSEPIKIADRGAGILLACWLDVRTRKQHGRLNAISGCRDRIIKIAQN